MEPLSDLLHASHASDVRPEDSDPGVALWSWCQVYLRRDRLPQRRVVVRFEFVYRGRPETAWLLIERGDAELCAFDPGFGDDVVVMINDPEARSELRSGLLLCLRRGWASRDGSPYRLDSAPRRRRSGRFCGVGPATSVRRSKVRRCRR